MAPRRVRSPADGLRLDGALEVADDLEVEGEAVIGALGIKAAQATAALSTSGAATTVPVQIPVGATLLAIAVKVNTIVAGVNSTEFDVAFAGNLNKAIASDVPIAVLSGGTGWRINVPLPPSDDFVTQGTPPSPFTESNTDVTITLKGGADNTPSGGNVTVLVHYLHYAQPAA